MKDPLRDLRGDKKEQRRIEEKGSRRKGKGEGEILSMYSLKRQRTVSTSSDLMGAILYKKEKKRKEKRREEKRREEKRREQNRREENGTEEKIRKNKIR